MCFPFPLPRTPDTPSASHPPVPLRPEHSLSGLLAFHSWVHSFHWIQETAILLSRWAGHSFNGGPASLLREAQTPGLALPKVSTGCAGLGRSASQSSKVSVCTNCLGGVLLTGARRGRTCSLVMLGQAGPEVAAIINPVAIAAVSVHLPRCDLEQ